MKNNDISISLSNFLMKVSGCWLATTDAEQRRRIIARNYTFMILLFGVYMDVSDICHSLDDINNLLYMAANLLLTSIALLKTIILHLNKEQFLKLVMYTQRNFWHSNYDDDEKVFVDAARRYFTFIVLLAYLVMIYITCSYICIPAYGKILVATDRCYPNEQTDNYFTIFAMFNLICNIENVSRNHSERVLPFRMWSDLPLYESPYFEICFTVQALCVFQIGICYVCLDNFLLLLNTHIACQFRILQYKLLNLLDPNSETMHLPDNMDHCYQGLRRYIRRHQALVNYCDRLEIIFSFNIFSYMLVFSVLTCLSLYQALLGNISVARRFSFIVYIGGNIFQLLMVTSACGTLITESTNVGAAAYAMSWVGLSMKKSGRSIRRDVRMIIMRSQKPCQLTAGGFFPVSLQTSTKLISSAMSYFTLLKQSSSNLRDE